MHGAYVVDMIYSSQLRTTFRCKWWIVEAIQTRLKENEVIKQNIIHEL